MAAALAPPAGASAAAAAGVPAAVVVSAAAEAEASPPVSTSAHTEEDDTAAAWDSELGERVTRQRSIYDAWTPRKRYMLLMLMALCTFIVPFSDTVYLPAMSVIQRDLNTSATMMAATVAAYMFVVGGTALVWGPFADRFGRRRTLLLTSALFTGVSVACVFSPTVEVLIGLRSVQGAAVSAMMVCSNAVLADSWEPAQRGKAMGIFMIPTLVGPIVGPLLGGGLSQAVGWRSTFVAMAVCGGVAFVGLLFFMEETHHHFVLERIRKSEGDLAAKSIREHPQIPKPVFRPPWHALAYLVELPIFPHALVMFLLYSTMFSSLIILPYALSRPPYSLSEALIGVANLPLGFGCFVMGPLGGRWADAGARRWSASPAGRMAAGTASALILFPISTLIYGWTLGYSLNLAGPLIASFFMGLSICAYFPGVMSYVSILKQQNAAAAGGALQAMMFICGGVFIQVTPLGMASLGVGGWVTLLVGMCFAGAVLSAVLTTRAIRAAEAGAAALPVTDGDAKTAAAAGAGAAAELAPGGVIKA